MHGRLRARSRPRGRSTASRPTSTASCSPRTGRASRRSWRAPIRRVPAIADAGVSRIINGPEGFTPDNEFILGESEVRGFFVAAGFCAHGIAGAGGIGRQMASWIVDGEPELDLWKMDIRRFGPAYRSPGATRWPASIEDYATYYDIHYPNEERQAGRPLRTSPDVRARSPALGRVVRREVRLGAPELVRVERRRAATTALRPRGWAGQHWSPAIGAEALATRHGRRRCSTRLVRQARGQRPGRARPSSSGCAPTTSTAPVGSIVYTQLLDRRGGIQADLTVTRLDEATVPARHRHGVRQPRRGLAAPAPAGRRVGHASATSPPPGSASGCGVRARATSCRPSRATTSPTPASRTSPRARSASAPCRSWPSGSPTSASSAGSCTPRRSTAGPCGRRCGRPAGRTAWSPAGYRAIDALRLEKGYRVWSSDITPDETPFEAGLGFAVALDKEPDFIGRDALVAAKAAGPRKRLRCLVLDDPRSVCLGNEPVRVEGEIVGRVTSRRLRLRRRAVDRLRLPAARQAADRDPRRVEVFGDWIGFEVAREPLYDPDGARIRA